MNFLLRNWKKYLPVIGIILFVYILAKIDFSEVVKEVSQVNVYFISIAIIVILIRLFSETLKWFTIARFQDMKIPFKKAFKINLVENYYGFITPSKVGSVIRAEYLKEYADDKIGKGLFNFVIDKILDVSAILFIALLFSYQFKDTLDLPVTFFSALFLVFVLGILFFIKKERSYFILKFFHRKLIPSRLREKAKVTFNSFYEHVPRKRYFVLFFALNFINWLLNYLTAYYIGLSLGIEVPLVVYFAIYPIGTLVTMIPISINGLGTREATLISLFGLFSVGAAKVFSMSIIGLVIAGIIPCIIGIYLSFKKRL